MVFVPAVPCTDALFCYDEGPGAGLGHRRRMEVLARELHARGWGCRLASTDAAARIEARVVVLDSYRLRADDPSVSAALVVALDDLRRDLAVDVVVDPSPGASRDHHTRAARVLAGARYALVALPSVRSKPVAATDPVTRVLVTTGAADAEGVGARIAGAIVRECPGLAVRLVVGPWGRDGDAGTGVQVLHAPPSLADEMAQAQVVVTAGGVSLLEAALLGRAIVAVPIADNQVLAVESMAAAGAAVRVPADPLAPVATAVAELKADDRRRRQLSDSARAQVDGRGAVRVAQEIVEAFATTGA